MKFATAVVIVFVLAMIYCVYNYFAMQKITVSNYVVSDKRIKKKIRIVHLSDLHLKEFGEFNGELAKKISEQNPDVVVVTGDMCRRGNKDYTPITQLLEEVVKTAPVYYALGNHELDYLKDYNDEILREIKRTGTVILDNEIACLEVKGSKLKFLGLSWYEELSEYGINSPEIQEEIKLLNKFCQGDDYKILLCHYPEYAKSRYKGKCKEFLNCKFDLMFSGHAHGGLVRLPFIGGVIAPSQGLFPKYDKGIYDFDGFKLVVSAGLGDTGYFFRVNNPPEVVTVDLVPNEQ